MTIRTTKKHRYALGIIFLLLFIVLIWNLLTGGSSAVLISPIPDETNGNITLVSPKNVPEKNSPQLLEKIKQLIDKQKGSYSVYVYDLNSSKGFGINETTIFTAASVNKVPILAALYYKANKGQIDLDERITIQEKDIQDYGTGIIRYQGAGSTYSYKTLAQLMMKKSDNTAAYILTNTLRTDKIQELLNLWKLTQTDIVNNKTSNIDMAILLTKMYRGQITNKASTIEMLGFMNQSDFENRLPALLPREIKVFHKIGNEVGNIHDVGIVELENRPYYIGVLTNDVTDDTTTETLIAQISRLVYDYMTIK